MGVLTPSKDEVDLLRRQFEEKVRLIGTEGWYYEVKDHKVDLRASYDKMQYFDPLKIDFLYEEMPNPKTLRNLNWWDDSEDTTPPIAYLPYHIKETVNGVLKPSVGSLLEIVDPLSGSSRRFEIQEVNMNTLYLIYSIVKLTPCREEKKFKAGSINQEESHQKSGGSMGYEFIRE